MREKLAAAALLACAAAVRSAGQPAGGGAARGALRYTVELAGLQERSQRLELRLPGWRLLLQERGEGLESDCLALGLAGPWGGVGPVAGRGLLRALSDPLGHAPDSAVFDEPTGLRLEGVLQGASRRGLWLEPFPGRLGLFALRKLPPSARSWGAGLSGSPGLAQAGCTAAFRRVVPGAGLALGQALMLLSLPPEDGPGGAGGPEAGDWLLERPSFPGGGLLHLAGSLRLESGSGRLACLLLGAASGGELLAPGLLGLCRVQAAGGPAAGAGRWSAQGLLGACSPGYRLPEGPLYAGSWAAGLRLEAAVGREVRLAASWRRRLDRPPPAPARVLPGKEEGELSALLGLALRGGGRLEARAEGCARGSFEADGEVQRAAGGGLDLDLLPPGRRGSLGLGLRGEWKEGRAGLRGELRGQLRGERRLLCWTAGAAGLPGQGAAPRWRPFARLELTAPGCRFWVSAGSGEGGRQVSLGWSATQALSKSPTQSTSRRRR